MSRLSYISDKSILRKNRVKKAVRGTTERPRLCVRLSASNVSAQIIDDEKQSTIVSHSSVNTKIGGTMTEKAAVVGQEIAKKAKAKKVKKVVLDRGSKIYHGRIKALAEAAR